LRPHLKRTDDRDLDKMEAMDSRARQPDGSAAGTTVTGSRSEAQPGVHSWARAACYRVTPALLAVARDEMTLAVMGEPDAIQAVLGQVGRLIGRPFGAPLPLEIPGWSAEATDRLLRQTPGLTSLFRISPSPGSAPRLVFQAPSAEAEAEGLVRAAPRSLAGRPALVVHPPPGVVDDGPEAEPLSEALLDAGLVGVPVVSGPQRGREQSDSLLLLDRLAETIHGFYLENAWTRGEPLGSTPALQPWDSLPDTYRDANRAQADHVSLKLETAGLMAIPQAEGVATDTVAAPAWGDPRRVEALSILEHDRWASDRLLAGWTYGPHRDNARRLHPDLVPYDSLSEDVREKDRVAVLTLPLILRLAGLVYRPLQPVWLRGPWPWAETPPGTTQGRRLRRAAEATARERAPLIPEFIAMADNLGACSAAVVLGQAGFPVALAVPRLVPAGLADPARRRAIAALLPLCRRWVLTEAVVGPHDLIARWDDHAGLMVDRTPIDEAR